MVLLYNAIVNRAVTLEWFVWRLFFFQTDRFVSHSLVENKLCLEEHKGRPHKEFSVYKLAKESGFKKRKEGWEFNKLKWRWVDGFCECMTYPCYSFFARAENMRNTRTPPILLDMNLFSIYLYRKLSYSVHVSNSAHNKLQRENFSRSFLHPNGFFTAWQVKFYFIVSQWKGKTKSDTIFAK